jgi:LemA protein
VKGYAAHESGVFQKVTEARAAAMQAGSASDKAQAENALTGTLKSLFAIAENYPELKSSNVMMTFMSQNEGTENRISVERMRFNEAVKAYNLKVMRIPSSVIAALTGFKERAYFEAAPGSEKAPEVKF